MSSIYPPVAYIPSSSELQALLRQAIAAMKAWNGKADLPSDPLALLLHDQANLSAIAAAPELARLIAGRIYDGHLGVQVVRVAARRHWGRDGNYLLGLHPKLHPPTTTQAQLVRHLIARFLDEAMEVV